MNVLEKAKKNFLMKEKYLSPYATLSKDAIRFGGEKEDIRPPYFHDIDRIIHSLSYTRYLNKTQVYPMNDNDHVSRRITHVQLVSKIARTIGRALNLNEDLIEAIALGHDIGHTPLGHAGESMINEICQKELGCSFAHNIQGVRYYLCVANGGKGHNLTLQVLDGIMTHNGEMVSPIYEPMKKTKEEFLREYEEAYQDLKKSKTYRPMTLEGCVVRISDIIGYIGRDIEDAIMIGKFDRKDLPESITSILGNNNRDIVNTIILDIIKESMDKPYIKMSDKVYQALFALKNFNQEHIYRYSLSTIQFKKYQAGMWKLYHQYYNDLVQQNQKSVIYTLFLNHQDDFYCKNTSLKRQIIDFLCGMTDDFFLKELKKIR